MQKRHTKPANKDKKEKLMRNLILKMIILTVISHFKFNDPVALILDLHD